MDALLEVNRGLYLVLGVLATLVALRAEAHRPVAAYIAWMAVEGFVRHVVLRHLGTPGLDWLLSPLDHLIVTSWSMLFVACCVHYFVRRGTRYVFVAWAVVLVAWWLGPEDVESRYRALYLVGLAASWVCILYGMFRPARVEPGLAHLSLILYASADIVILTSPLRRGVLANWSVGRFVTMLLLVALIIAHSAWLLRRRSQIATSGSSLPPQLDS